VEHCFAAYDQKVTVKASNALGDAK